MPVYFADAFLKYPENWMKGPGVFVVPVNPNKGLWFDWRDNDENNTAVIPTVKGCNPITGLQTTGFFMERYDNKCPKHGCDFQANRFCPECGYKWPDRGYVSQSPLWWDGFRSDDGSVRQFFFTEEMMRDVATHMIGKENTVPAFGFAFYSPKEPRPKAVNVTRTTVLQYAEPEPYIKYLVPPQHMYLSKSWNNCSDGSTKSLNSSDGTISAPLKAMRSRGKKISSEAVYYSSSVPRGASADAVPVTAAGAAMLDECRTECLLSTDPVQDYSLPDNQERGVNLESYRERQSYVPQKEVAVGAGAKIRQELPEDKYPLDSWKDKPDAVMTVYFVFQEEFNKMAEGGMKDFKDCKDGMLQGLPVG